VGDEKVGDGETAMCEKNDQCDAFGQRRRRRQISVKITAFRVNKI
jgi:hypothetical protein